MRIFLTLYRFEIKKIRTRKILGISILVGMLILGAAMALPWMADGYYYVYEAGAELPERVPRPNREIEPIRREYLMKDSGQVLDETLMEQWKAAYLDSEAGTKQWNLNGYTPFLYLNTMPDRQLASAEDFYKKYNRMTIWEQEREELTEAELSYWEEKAANLAPYTVGYAGGWQNMIANCFLYSLVTLLVVTVVFCDSFSEEHRLGTDQLVLACAKGRRWVFAAKMAAGVSLSAGIAVLGFLVQLAVCGIFYGFSGFQVSIQFSLLGNGCLYALMHGQYMLLMLVLLVLASVMVSCFVMLLSEITCTPVYGLITIFLLGVMDLLGIFRQIGGWVWRIGSYLPTARIQVNTLTDYLLVHVGGWRWNAIEVSLILYPMMAVAFGFLCWKGYDRFQVTGR